jgi:hypothetical protein
MDQALLPGDPADKHHRRPVQLHAQCGHDVDVGVGGELVGVDAVLDHVHLVRIQVGVGVQGVGPHAGADRDHRVGAFEGRPLRPGRQLVATTQLFGLPGPVRLQGMGTDDVRNVVEQPGQVTGQVRVPGVGVDQVHLLWHRGDHRQVRSEDPQRGVRAWRIVLCVRRRAIPRFAHALHVDVDQLPQLGYELRDVYASAPIDRWGVLAGQQRDGQAVFLDGHHVGIVPQRGGAEKACATRDASCRRRRPHPRLTGVRAAKSCHGRK